MTTHPPYRTTSTGSSISLDNARISANFSATAVLIFSIKITAYDCPNNSLEFTTLFDSYSDVGILSISIISSASKFSSKIICVSALNSRKKSGAAPLHSYIHWSGSPTMKRF